MVLWIPPIRHPSFVAEKRVLKQDFPQKRGDSSPGAGIGSRHTSFAGGMSRNITRCNAVRLDFRMIDTAP